MWCFCAVDGRTVTDFDLRLPRGSLGSYKERMMVAVCSNLKHFTCRELFSLRSFAALSD